MFIYLSCLIVRLAQIRAVKPILSLRAPMIYYKYIPQLLSDLSGIWYIRSSNNAYEHLWASLKSGRGRPYTFLKDINNITLL